MTRAGQAHAAKSRAVDVWYLTSCGSVPPSQLLYPDFPVEPVWAELLRRHGRELEFGWKIALMDPSGLPVSRDQLEWFYRRSGIMMRASYKLNSGWYDAALAEYLAPNAVPEAARDMGVTDDSVRIAIAEAAVLRGERVGDWEVSARIASETSGLFTICVINGTAAGGGYELALAADHIMLIDDGSSSVSLPELPLLAVLPGTGGLTRVTDKRKVRRDRADVFCTTEEGIKGKRAVDWRLVDEVVPASKLEEAVEKRAREFAARSQRRLATRRRRCDRSSRRTSRARAGGPPA